jgi:hypothetical protein
MIQQEEWASIRALVDDAFRKRGSEITQGTVIKRDEQRRVVWVKEFGDDPIPVVGHGTEAYVMQGGTRKTITIPPAIPDVGETIIIGMVGGFPKCLAIQDRESHPTPMLGMQIGAESILDDAILARHIAADQVGASELADASVGDSNVIVSSIEGRRLNFHEGSSPPGSPQVEDLWKFHPGTGISWLFQYEPDQDATYPWQFIGGAPLSGSTAGGDTTAGGGFRPDTSLELTLARAGIYDIRGQMRVWGQPNANISVGWDSYIAYRIGTSGAWTQWGDSYMAHYFGANSFANGVVVSAHIACGPIYGGFSADTRLRFYAAGLLNWDFTAANRTISAIPLRVA